MEYKYVDGELCQVTTEYCDLGYDHEVVLPATFGPITLEQYETSEMMRKMFLGTIEAQMEAHAKFSKMMGKALDRKFDGDIVTFKIKDNRD